MAARFAAARLKSFSGSRGRDFVRRNHANFYLKMER